MRDSCSSLRQLGVEKLDFKHLNCYLLNRVLFDSCFLKETDRYEDDCTITGSVVVVNSAGRFLLKHSIEFLKNSSQVACTGLVDMFGGDRVAGGGLCVNRFVNRSITYNRFCVEYIIRSIGRGFRANVCVEINNQHLLTISKLFGGAGWCEREIWDMFGISFLYNADLRRILTDYGFRGFPLRKDFPVVGFVEVRFDSECPGILYADVMLQQEDRRFNFVEI